MASFSMCNRLVLFRLTVKVDNPKLHQFKYFKYGSRNKNIESLPKYKHGNQHQIIMENCKTSDNFPLIEANSRKTSCQRVLKTKFNSEFILSHNHTQELEGIEYPWHHGELYTIIRRTCDNDLVDYLSYCMMGSEFHSEGPYNLGKLK